MQLIGRSEDGQFDSDLFTQTENNGDAGNLSIETGNLIVRDRAQVSSSTAIATATGNASEINIETRSLFVTNKARINVDDRRIRVDSQGTDQTPIVKPQIPWQQDSFCKN